jgi:hypothetical protein
MLNELERPKPAILSRVWLSFLDHLSGISSKFAIKQI